MEHIEKLILSQSGTLIDVRTPSEYEGGNPFHSINIPLQEIPQRMDELSTLPQPFLLCCASGNRSGQATHYLSNQGFECYNAGSWLSVYFIQSQQTT